MNCQHVQQLLAFAQRKCEMLEPADQAAIEQHLANCTTCAAPVQADRGADEALGAVMRDVPVPPDLQQKLMKRLAAERSRLPWKRGIAAAAVLLAVMAGALGWYYKAHPEVRSVDAVEYVYRGGLDEDQIEQYFVDQGLPVRVPRDFDYQYLQHIDVVEFKGRRVAKLTFSRTENPSAFATVLILSTKQFRINDPELRKDQVIPHTTSIRIRPEVRNGEPFTDLIFYRGELDALRREMR